jgi:tetratricopeptide (TPR) repeat protein
MGRRYLLRACFFVLLLAAPLYAQQIADEQSRRQAIEFYRTGQEQMAAEHFDLAAQAFTAAIDKDALLTVAHYQLGQAYMNLKRYASAIAAYKGAIESMRALHNLRETHKFEVDRQRDDEIHELRSVIDRGRQGGARQPTIMALEERLRDLEEQKRDIGETFNPPAGVLLALGSAFFRNGDLPAAEIEWKAAVAADPKYGEAHNNLAVVYLMTMRKKEAENAVKAAEKAGFRVNPQLKEDIKRLAS